MCTLRFMLISLFLSLALCASSQPGSKVSDLDWKVVVTDPFMTQINELAKVSPIIGGDTESYWAASVVDSIFSVSKKNPYNYYEQVALCNLAQKTILYSMGYFTAILGTYRDKELSDQILTTIPRSKNAFQILADSKFNQLRLLTDDTHSVTLEYAAFFKLYSLVAQEDPFNCTNQISSMVRFMEDQDRISTMVSDSLQAYRLCSVIEQSSFFITYCSMFRAFKFEEQHERTKDSIMDIARWFDAYTIPIQCTLMKNSPNLSPFYMNDKAYFEFMKEATARKITLLEYIVEAIKNIEKGQRNAPRLEDENR